MLKSLAAQITNKQHQRGQKMHITQYAIIENAPAKAQTAAWKSLEPLERKILSSIVSQYDSYATLGDLYEHGANTGWPGLTYSCEMRDFCRKNRAKVVRYWATWLEEMEGAGDGLECITLKCWKGYSIAEIVTDIATGAFEFTADGLCWLMAENGASELVDYIAAWRDDND